MRTDSVSGKQGGTSDALEADLLGHTVLIDPKSAQIGGAWQQKDASGKPCAWDPDVVAFFLDRCTARDAPFILDIGANTGLFCLLPVINHAVSGFAFEPNPEVYELLKRNLALNNLAGKIQTFPFALAENGERTSQDPSFRLRFRAGLPGHTHAIHPFSGNFRTR